MLDHVLVPVTPGHAGDYATAIQLAKTILNSGGKLSVIAVMEEVPPYVDAYIPSDVPLKNRAATAEELAAEFGAHGAETHVVVGHPANKILEWSEQNGVDCVVISSHRPGLSDYFLGSTAARVVRHAKCSVHVIR